MYHLLGYTLFSSSSNEEGLQSDANGNIQEDTRAAGIRSAVGLYFKMIGKEAHLKAKGGKRLAARVRAVLVKRLGDFRSNFKKIILARLKEDYLNVFMIDDHGIATKYKDLPDDFKDDLAEMTLAAYVRLPLEVIKNERKVLWADYQRLLKDCWDVRRVRNYSGATRMGDVREWDPLSQCFKVVSHHKRSRRIDDGAFDLDLETNPWPMMEGGAAGAAGAAGSNSLCF